MSWPHDVLVIWDDEPLYLTTTPEPLFFYGDEVPGAGVIVRPTITIISPPDGGLIGPAEPFVFDVTCSEPIALQRFNVRTGGPGSPWEVQYRDGETSPNAVVVREAITDGWRFTARRTPRWTGLSVEFEPLFGTANAIAALNE